MKFYYVYKSGHTSVCVPVHAADHDSFLHELDRVRRIYYCSVFREIPNSCVRKVYGKEVGDPEVWPLPWPEENKT